MAPKTNNDIEVTSDLLAQLAESDIESEGDTSDASEDDLDDEIGSKRKSRTGEAPLEPPSKHRKGDAETYDDKYFLPPTTEELTALRETQMLYHSNLFRLQVKELFENSSIKPKHLVRIKQWISDFSQCLVELPCSKSLGLENPQWIEDHDLVIPLHAYYNLIPKQGGTFRFMPPTSIETIGSFSFGLINKSEINIDLALILPQDFFHKKDLYNGRWIILRAMYLSWLSKQLEGSELVSQMEWSLHCHCDSRPVLKVTPHLAGKCSINFFLYPVPPEGLYNWETVGASRPLVLSSYMFARKESEDKNTPTPFYNWTCGLDVVMMKHNNLIKSKLKDQNIIDGLKLLKQWWMQRDFNKGPAGMSFHVVIMYALYLVENRRLNEQMSDYQVFRTILLAFSESNWSTDGPSLFEEDESELVTKKGKKIRDSKLVEMSKLYQITFVDPSGSVNLAGQTSLNTYKEIQFECRKAITALESSSSDSFEALFLSKMDFYLAFDQFIKIRFTELEYNKCIQKLTINPESILLDFLGVSPSYIWKSVFDALERGLGDRVNLISCRRPPPKMWKLNEAPPAPVFKATFGLLLNENSFGLLTKGPSAESEDAKSFREFWGEKSMLRRFKDGSFHEAVLWGEPEIPTSERRRIPFEVSKYLLDLRFGFTSKNVAEVSAQIEDVIRIGDRWKTKDDFGTGEELLQSCTFSFDSLCKTLRKAELPLKISSIVPTSDVSRHSCVFPPMKIAVPQFYKDGNNHKTFSNYNLPIPSYRRAIDGLIFLEISGKWPDDLLAVQAIKVEFLICLSSFLKKQRIRCIVYPESIQIIWEGHIFRLKLCHRREIYLRRLVSFTNLKLKANAEIQERDTSESLKLEVDIEILPRITTALNSIKNEHPCYSASVRLILRWVSSHMLLRHIGTIGVELLCAHLFLRPEPYSAPYSPHVALFRFMKLVAHTDWNSTPILVNVGGQFKANDESEILKMFTEQRDQFAKMFVCSPCELRGSEDNVYYDLQRRFSLLSTWTSNSPTTPILGRLRLIAKAGLSFYEEEMKKKIKNLKSLFVSPLEDYEVLIHLRMKKLSRKSEKISHIDENEREKMKPYLASSREQIPIVEFDPVEYYLNDLEEAFSEHCLFFHDIHGGSVIGVVFKPESKQMKDLKVANLQGEFITHGKISKTSANMEAIIKDFEFMGRGIVKSVEVRNENK